MKLYTYHNYGDLSDEATTVIGRIRRNDTSDPLNVILSSIDFEEEGYTTDGEELDGSPTEAFPDGRVSLLYYQWIGIDPKQYLEVFINGAATLAKGIPFRFCEAAPGAAKLSRCVPRLDGVLTECSIVFQRPDGSEPIVYRYQQSIV
jgi:hypothetical protein